jgi:hypothetical protein
MGNVMSYLMRFKELTGKEQGHASPPKDPEVGNS